jgi:glycosyltransferase involved in cell wall biosynthesis
MRAVPKKALFIAYLFPPIGGSGVQRTAKFVKYLPGFGWQPLVVCGDDGDVFQDGWDPTLLEEIPAEARVWRTRFVSPLGFRRRVQRMFRIRPAGQAPPAQSDPPLSAPPASPSPARRLARLLAAPLGPLEFPPVDAALYWALSILPLCRRVIAVEKPDLIFTTSFPYSDHLAGYLLKRMTGLPWVADFRDPWTQNAFAGNRGWRREVDQWLERRVLETADKIIGVTPTYTQGLRELATGRPADDFLTIENGYDQADFSAQADHLAGESNGRVRIAHVGKVYAGSAGPFLQALCGLAPQESARLKVVFVGGLPQADRQCLQGHLPGAAIEVTERVPHPQAIEHMRRADAILLTIDGGPAWQGHYPGKLFEYLASGTPILMLGPRGDAARLVQDSGAGCFVPADDAQALAEALRLLAADPGEFRRCYYHPRPEVIARYERQALTQRLAAVYDALTPS